MQTSCPKALVSHLIALGSRCIMSGAVDLHGELSFTTEEVDRVGIHRMLSPKLQSARTTAKLLPKQDFRKRHFLAQLARGVDDRALKLLMPPSTSLRLVPLPVPGRI